MLKQSKRTSSAKTNSKNNQVKQTDTQLVADTENVKELDDYELSKPLQLGLFEFLQPEEKHYSNTIELYDFMPKYYWGKADRINGKFLEVLDREFECRGKKYKIEIAPAVITDSDGIKRYYYPSKREELVEEALRRFATAKQGVFLDDVASVTFTLYLLQQELKQNGHSYSIKQIKDSLLICAKTSVTVTAEDGAAILISNLFETLGLQTREDWKGTGTKSKAFVRFNALVTESIKNGTYRQLNYEKSMSYKSVIARQLHKRMSHHYTQASIAQPYHILLSTIIRDFGLTEYDKPSHNLRNVLKALNEMKEQEVLLSYKVEKTLDVNNRNKTTDAKLILIPHPKFAGEVIRGNKRQAHIAHVLRESN